MTASTKTVIVRYFAILREQRGLNEEQIETSATTARELYAELRAKHRFSLTENLLKVVLNEDFSDWSTALKSGDSIAFIPPVAGG
jgi:molybdopterin converting factor subunit 1